MPSFMKVSDAVNETGLSRAHIYRLVNQGTVQGSDDAGVRTVDVDGLKRFIEESSSTTRRGRKPAVTKKTGRSSARTSGSSSSASASSSTKSGPRTRRASARAPKVGSPVSAKTEQPASSVDTSGASDAQFLRHEVDRLWHELEARRQEHASERDRLLKTIELLSQK